MERFPDFFIVGAAKSGTTALWKYLGTVPGIFMTKDIRDKELGYFSNGYGVTDRQDYLDYFKEAKSNELIGESCHPYLTSEESAELIKMEVPNARIVISLRNPAKRAFSLYNWMVMYGYESAETFEEALRLEEIRLSDPAFVKRPPHLYLKNYAYYSTGLYFEQVKRYYEVFGAENVKVMIFEEFINPEHPEHVWDMVKFLGIETKVLPVFKRENESFGVKNIQKQFYYRNVLFKKLKKNWWTKRKALKIVDYFINRNIDRSKKVKISNDTYKDLMSKYHDDIQVLSSLINKNLSKYWH